MGSIELMIMVVLALVIGAVVAGIAALIGMAFDPAEG